MQLTKNENLITNNHNLNLKTDLRHRSYLFSLSVIKLVSGFPRKGVYWIISDQLLRAATSVGANIIEAKASASKRDFTHFFQIALKSANETEYWLYILRDSGLSKGEYIEKLITEVREISRMLGSSLLTLKGKR